MKNAIKKTLKKYSHDKVMMDIEGNYEESHPHELLEILKKEKNEDSVDVGSEEADKLLKEKKIMNNSG